MEGWKNHKFHVFVICSKINQRQRVNFCEFTLSKSDDFQQKCKKFNILFFFKNMIRFYHGRSSPIIFDWCDNILQDNFLNKIQSIIWYNVDRFINVGFWAKCLPKSCLQLQFSTMLCLQLSKAPGWNYEVYQILQKVSFSCQQLIRNSFQDTMFKGLCHATQLELSISVVSLLM